MNITLTNYQPGQLTRALLSFGSDNWLDLARKVGKAAGAIFALIPALIADFFLSTWTFLHRRCVHSQPGIEPLARPQPNPPPAVPQPVRAGRGPHPDVVEDFVHPDPLLLPAWTDALFFKETLRRSLEHLPPIQKANMLADLTGMPGSHNGSIHALFWSAASLLIQYFLLSPSAPRLTELYPTDSEVIRLNQLFQNLSPEEKTIIGLQVIKERREESEWSLTPEASHLKAQIVLMASLIAYAPRFGEIYLQATALFIREMAGNRNI